MSIGLFGKKLGMTRIFTDDGISIPVTFVKVETCQVSQIKTIDTDGYNAVQVSAQSDVAQVSAQSHANQVSLSNCV